MMHKFTVFGGEKLSLTVIDDVMRFLGNGALTKKWSDDFESHLPEILVESVKLLITQIARF